MSGGSGGQAAMTVVWVVLVVLAIGGLGVLSLARRRRARRPSAGTIDGAGAPPGGRQVLARARQDGGQRRDGD